MTGRFALSKDVSDLLSSKLNLTGTAAQSHEERRLIQPGTACRNVLLNALDEDDFDHIRPHLQRVALNTGHVIVGQGEPITFVCFPECGVTSVADVLEDGTRVELALVGRDGMTNSQLLLGCSEAPHEAIVQIGGGSSLRLEADRLRDFCAARPKAHALFLRFIHALSIQTARTLTSNLLHCTEQRLSRWLLMCHDRVEGDELHLKHDHIGRMLGVRRATVTDALHILEEKQVLRGRRGLIVIRDRGKLEEVAGEAYGHSEAHYERLIGAFGKRMIKSRLAG
jgi:CRP-like cAMP-binding protein